VHGNSNPKATIGVDTENSTKNDVRSAGKEKPISVGKLAGASGMSIATFAPKAIKGMMVDIPLALTEGLKNVPRAYGDTIRQHGPVTDFKSGATVAGKTFVWGFADGLSDVVIKPYQGAQREGVKGAAKGLGKGLVNMTTKTGAGMFGLLGYTGAGIAKSLRTAIHTRTGRSIADARHVEGRWLVEQGRYSTAEADVILQRLKVLI
jgi:hypothetical protein